MKNVKIEPQSHSEFVQMLPTLKEEFHRFTTDDDHVLNIRLAMTEQSWCFSYAFMRLPLSRCDGGVSYADAWWLILSGIWLWAEQKLPLAQMKNAGVPEDVIRRVNNIYQGYADSPEF